MASHGPLKKPTMASMPVLLFLVDHPELLYVVSGSLGETYYHFAYKNGSRYQDATDFKNHYWEEDLTGKEQKEKPDWYYNDLAPEITKSLGDHRWHQSGWMKSVRKTSKGDDPNNPDNHWAWYDHPARLTKPGREIVEKHRAEYEAYAVKQLEKQKEIERLVIVKDNVGYGHNRKYGFLARVVRETKSRLYVEHVPVEGDKKSVWCYHYPSLHGRDGHQYVDRADVVTEHVTETEYCAMRKVEGNHLEWLDALKDQEEIELDEIRERYRERREQNKYAFEDELREALDKVKNNGT